MEFYPSDLTVETVTKSPFFGLNLHVVPATALNATDSTVDAPSRCPLCKACEESNNHIVMK